MPRGALRGTILARARLHPGELGIADGLVHSGPHRSARTLPRGWVVAPGMVDLQVNGFAGAEVGDDQDELQAVARALPAAGVSAFCPTLVTRSGAAYRRAASALAGLPWPDDGARSLGVHLEGPFLSPERAGAHPPGRMRDPTPAAVDQLVRLLRPRIVTLAPERRGGLDAIARLRECAIVPAVGHTDADEDLGRRAIAAGAGLLTHAPNAMRAIEARAPSALVAFLADRRTFVSMIGDGVHVAPSVAALIARLAGSRLVLVSDAVAAAASPPGRYRLGERSVRFDGRRVTLDRRLAGSASPLWHGPVTLMGAGIARARALSAACEAPRRLLGLPGLIPDAPADLVVLDTTLVPRLTLVGGRVAFADPALPFDVPERGRPFAS